MYDSIEFQIEGVDVIAGAESFDSGMETLIETYKKIEDPNEQAAAKQILTEYGSKIRQKFKQDYYGFDEAIQYAPVKVADILGEDDDTTLDESGQVAKITEWENANLKYLDETNDPDQLAVKDSLKFSIENVASAARRDIMGKRTEDSFGGYVKDKFFRVYAGTVSSFEKLTDANLLGKGAFERTAPSMDDSIVSDFASGAGSLVGMVGAAVAGTAVAGPGAGTAAAVGVGVAQGAGEVRERYNSVLRDTGIESNAQLSAGIETVGQAIQILPTARLAGKVVGRVGGTIVDKAAAKLGKPVREIGGAFVEEALTEGTGQVFSNVAEGVGYGTEIDYVEGVGRSAFVGGVLSGSLAGVGYGAQRAILNKYEKQLKEQFPAEEPLPESGIPEDKVAEATLRESYVSENKFEGDWKDKFFNAEGLESAKYEPSEDPYRAESKPEVPWKPTAEDNADFYSDTIATPESVAAPEATVLNVESDSVDPMLEKVSISQAEAVQNRDQVVRLAPGRLVYMLAKAVAGEVTARSYLAGAFGQLATRGTGSVTKNRIDVVRALGSDPNKLIGTMAHEIGHAVDYLYSQIKNVKLKSVEPVIRKMHAVKSIVDGLSNETIEIVENFEESAKDLSKFWRGDWTKSDNERYIAYREDKKEVQADVFSALLYNPSFVRENFPDVFKAFEYGLSKQPAVEAAWNNLNELINDPAKTLEYHYASRKQAAIRQGELNQEAIKASQDSYQKRNSFVKAIQDFYQQFFSTDRVISAAIKKNRKNKKVRDELIKNQQNIKSVPFLRDEIDRKITQPMRKILQRLVESKLPDAVVAFSDYLWINKVRTETTRTIENIKQNFDKYAAAATWLIDPNNIVFRGSKTNLDYNSAIADAIAQGDPDALVTALAQMNIVFSTAENVKLEDFKQLYPNDPKKALKEFNLAKARSTQRKTSDLRVYVDELIAGMKEGVLKDTLTEILSPTAFNIRRLLINDSLDNIFDANDRLKIMEQVYAKEGMDFFQKESIEFYKAVNSMMGIVIDSEIFTPELLDRIKLNEGAYVTNLVLKYYEGDENISGTVKAAVGSMDEIGNEFAATTAKMIAIIERANRQNAANNVLEAAIRIGENVENIPVARGESIFDKQISLANKGRNEDVTYLIAYTQGKPYLFKVDNKNYKPMVESPYVSSWVRKFADTTRSVAEVFSTRAMLTVWSPAFVLKEKFRNKKNEAMLANSFFPTILGVHTDPKLRKINQQSREWLKTLVEHKANGTPLPPEFAEILDQKFLSTLRHGRYAVDPLSEASGLSITEATYALLDPDARDSIDKTRSWDERVKNAIDKFLTDVPILGWGLYRPIKWATTKVEQIGTNDEIVTKLNGYQIAKQMGRSDAEAALFANLNFGTPDSMGGGTNTAVLNNAFMFFRAQFNGHRMLARMLDPRGEHRYVQFLYRGVMPKLMLTPTVGAAVIGMLLGEEEENKWKKILSKIPSWDLMTKDVIPWSLTDAEGNVRFFGSVTADEIDKDWRVNYLGIPHPREMALLSSIVVPALEELAQGELQEAYNKAQEAVGKGIAVQIPQLVQYAYNLLEISRGDNPTDFYRRKGILPPEVAAAGSLAERSAGYGEYMLSRQLPGIINYNPYKTSKDYTSILEKMTSDIPVISPLARSIFNTSNYGDYERNKDLATERQAILDNAKYNMGKKSKELHKMWARDNTVKSQVGKEAFEKQSSPDSLAKTKTMSTWYYSYYRKYLPLIRQAYENGDDEMVKRYSDNLEKYSSSYLKRLMPEQENQ